MEFRIPENKEGLTHTQPPEGLCRHGHGWMGPSGLEEELLTAGGREGAFSVKMPDHCDLSPLNPEDLFFLQTQAAALNTARSILLSLSKPGEQECMFTLLLCPGDVYKCMQLSSFRVD